jgi:hypothetical protein
MAGMWLDKQPRPSVVLKPLQQGKPGFARSGADLKDEDPALVVIVQAVEKHRKKRRVQLVRAPGAEGAEIADHGRTPVLGTARAK